MHGHTDAETVNQLAFNQQWHYALNITGEGEAAMSQDDRLTGVERLRVRGLKAVRFCATLHNAINQFFIPDAYSGPFALKMAA